MNVKRNALRRNIWFKALNRLERGIVDLTTRYIDNVRSTKLAKVLTAIMTKLEIAAETMMARMVRVFGRPLAKKISGIAVSWGNRSAYMWAEDADFARYLAICSASKGMSNLRATEG